MRIGAKGQVTIPQDIREKAGLLPGTEVSFEIDEGGVRLVKGKPRRPLDRGERIVERLRGTATAGLSTDEIMAMTRGE
jgi:AbrB family looped-hinge helix DNA binding protein